MAVPVSEQELRKKYPVYWEVYDKTKEPIGRHCTRQDILSMFWDHLSQVDNVFSFAPDKVICSFFLECDPDDPKVTQYFTQKEAVIKEFLKDQRTLNIPLKTEK